MYDAILIYVTPQYEWKLPQVISVFTALVDAFTAWKKTKKYLLKKTSFYCLYFSRQLLLPPSRMATSNRFRQFSINFNRKSAFLFRKTTGSTNRWRPTEKRSWSFRSKTFPTSKLSGLSIEAFLKEEFLGGNNNDELASKIQSTFTAILENGVLEQRLF